MGQYVSVIRNALSCWVSTAGVKQLLNLIQIMAPRYRPAVSLLNVVKQDYTNSTDVSALLTQLISCINVFVNNNKANYRKEPKRKVMKTQNI